MQEVSRMQESKCDIGEWCYTILHFVFCILLTASGNYMYAVGRNELNSWLVSAEIYDFIANQWVLLPNMKKERSGAAVVNCCHTLPQPTNICEVYDETMNKWRKIHLLMVSSLTQISTQIFSPILSESAYPVNVSIFLF